jgi:hypothetical protein
VGLTAAGASADFDETTSPALGYDLTDAADAESAPAPPYPLGEADGRRLRRGGAVTGPDAVVVRIDSGALGRRERASRDSEALDAEEKPATGHR